MAWRLGRWERWQRREGGGSLARDREGHGITGVCNRGRWLLQAQEALLGARGYLPMPLRAPVGDSLYRSYVLFGDLSRSLTPGTRHWKCRSH
jgi:hypothetical protein